MDVRGSFYTTLTHKFGDLRTDPVACNWCREERSQLLATELGFEIRQCVQCGLVYVSPQPVAEDLPKFYEGMYAGDPQDEAVRRSLGYVEKHIRSIVRRRKPHGGRLLDIGCGYGAFLKQMQSPTWTIEGLELDPTAAKFAQEQVPTAAIHQQPVTEAAFAQGAFDCIVMIAVLEHMKDPREVLQRVTRWLAPDGLLVVQCPYIAPFIRLKRWLPFLPINFEAPRHLFDFPPRILREYLTEAGCGDVSVEIGRPFASNGPLGAGLIWAVKLPGLALHALTAGRHIYPFSSAIVAHGIKACDETGTLW